MKSVTTCPSCQTQFLVTDEQLSQYNGKVRCGHCLSVFNAVEHIAVQTQNTPEANSEENTASNLAEKTEPQHVVSMASPAEPVHDEIATTAPADADQISTDSPTENQSFATEDVAVEHFTETPPENIIATESTAEQPVATTTPETKRADLLKELFEQANLPLEEGNDALSGREENVAASNASQAEQSEIDSQNYQEEMSKVNAFDYKPEYQYYLEQKKSTSPALLALGGALVLLALLQCAYFYRHTIAMQFPQTKPSLVSLCQTLGCKIDLPKEIQLFSIDDSTIEEDADHEGVIRLSSTITNRADFNQAYPNLEVTLTDTQDQPKLRRIFKPSEYLTKEFNLEEGIAAGDSITINMPLMADDLKPAGFRLLVSY